MKCYANRVQTHLFQVPNAAPVAASANGAPWRVLPDASDNQGDAIQDFKFVTALTMSGGAGSPTAQIVIQGSMDGLDWIDLATGTSRTADGSYKEVIDNTSMPLLPFIRARFSLGGTTAPSAYGIVDVISTAAFQLSSS